MKSHVFINKIIFYGFIKIIPALVNILTIVILWRVLSSESYLSYSVSIALPQLFAQISTAWICNAYLFYTSKKNQSDLFLRNNFYLCSASSFIGAFITGFASLFMFHNTTLAFISFGLCLSQCYFYFFSTVYQSRFLIREQFHGVFVQFITQVSMLIFIFYFTKNNFIWGVLALSCGFIAASLFLFFQLYSHLNLSFANCITTFKENIKIISSYGIPLAVWMCFSLTLLSCDKYLTYFLNIDVYDYLSLKDLLVGVSGLISMPILMLVHPLFFKLFNSGKYPEQFINNSIYLVSMIFASFWSIFYFPGLHLLASFTEKLIITPKWILLITYLGIAIGCISIYLQKRLEGHKKTIYLASLMGGCTIACYFFGVILGAIFGLAGIIVSFFLCQCLYFLVVSRSVKGMNKLCALLSKSLFMGLLFWIFGQLLWSWIDYYLPLEQNSVGVLLWLLGYIPVVLFSLMPIRELSRFEMSSRI